MRDRLAAVDRDVARHVHGERALARCPAGPRCTMRLPGCRPDVRLSRSTEPGGQPRVRRLAVLDRLEVEHRLVDQVAEHRHLVVVLAPGHVVDALLGVVGDCLGVVGRRVGELHDVGGGRDQPAPQRGVGHDLGVVGGGGRGGDLVDEIGEVEVAADVVERAAALERVDAGDDVDGLAAREQVRGAPRRCGRWPSGRSRRPRGSRRRRRWPRRTASSSRAPTASASRFCGGRRRPSPGHASNIVGRARHLPLPHDLASGGRPPRPGTLRPAHARRQWTTRWIVRACRSRAEIPCHSASDLRFPHVENHVDNCESHV